MLKSKSIKTLSLAIAGLLFTGTASASIVADTTSKPVFSAEPLMAGQWAAGYFFISDVSVCSNGCDITGVKLLLDLSGGYDNTSFSGVTLDLLSSQGPRSNPTMGSSLFQLTNPTTVSHTLNGGTGSYVEFTAAAQDQSLPALLQPNTGYWLKVSNETQTPEFGWFYDGNDPTTVDQYWATYYGSGSGTPFIFQVTGDNSVTPRLLPSEAIPNVPLPSAVWLMGSALIGFTLAGRRKKSI